jgi:hypothetical protein
VRRRSPDRCATTSRTTALAEGQSDIVPLDEDGTPLPYFRIADDPDDGVDNPG